MDARQQRGLQIAAVCRITEKNGFWNVPSQTGNGSYQVCLNPAPFVPQCTCPDHEATGKPCKHVFAVEYVVQRESNGDGTETITETLTVTSERVVAECPTYKQDWPATTRPNPGEGPIPGSLARASARASRNRLRSKGRPRASLRDMVFATVFKVFGTVSGRRFQCDMNDACAEGPHRQGPPLQHRLQVSRNARPDPDPQGAHRRIAHAAPLRRGRFRRGFERLRHVPIRPLVRPQVRLPARNTIGSRCPS